MCQFKSFVVNKQGRVFHLLDDQSHENIKEHFKLHDGNNPVKPNLVSCEIVPQDGNIFNQDLDNWVSKIDQDIVPDWFNPEDARQLGIRVLKETWEKRFAFDYVEKFDDKNGVYYVALSGTVKDNYGTVGNNSGTVGNNSGTVKDNYGTVGNNSGTVEYNPGTVEDNSGTVKDNSGTVKDNYGTVEDNYGTVECYRQGKVSLNKNNGIVVVNKVIYVANKDYKINRTKTENIGG